MNALPMHLPNAWGAAHTARLETLYHHAEQEAERAAEAVRLAAERYKAERTPANEDAYATADRRYDRARNAFQEASYNLLTARRCAARDKQERSYQAAQLSL